MNDAHGHGAGDYVLATLADVVRTIIRKEDVFARIGGEEFALLLRATPVESASIFAERMRVAIAQHPFSFEGHALAITVSIGVSTSTDEGVGGPTELVARADAALYRAKSGGRNCVMTAT